MDTKELEQVIYRALKMLKAEEHFVLLTVCGDSRYAIERFLMEAGELGKKTRLKVAVDENSEALLPDGGLKKPGGIESVYGGGCEKNYDEIFRGVDAVVFGSMDIGTASKIGSLMTDTLSSRIASEAFVRGIRVISDAFAEEMKIKNERYGAAVDELVQKLQGFGMEFMPVGDIKREFDKSTETRAETSSRIITEDAVRNLRGGELQIPADAVLTPLAKDALREKKITLTRGK